MPAKKSLKQSTHPIPPKRVEKDNTQYDRKKEKKQLKEEVAKEFGGKN